MPRTEGQKARILALLRILARKTDSEHRISAQQLLALLEAEGYPAERKSICSDVAALQQAGVAVESVRGAHGGYWLAAREFELPELKLLVDAVQASRFLSRRKSEQLIRKLEGLASEHEAKQMQRQVFVANRVKTMNESIYYIVDALHEAIGANEQVSFLYLDWNLQKEKVPRRGGQRYQVSPWALAWENDNYYLVAFEEGRGVRHYRVDKISRLERTGAPRAGRDAFADFDMAAYARTMFGMFRGEQQPVCLRCENRLVGPMLDRFGAEVTLLPRENGCFDLTVPATVSPQFLGWVAGFGGGVEILEPAGVRAEMAALAAKLAAQHGGAGDK